MAETRYDKALPSSLLELVWHLIWLAAEWRAVLIAWGRDG